MMKIVLAELSPLEMCLFYLRVSLIQGSAFKSVESAGMSSLASGEKIGNIPIIFRLLLWSSAYYELTPCER